MFRFSQDILEFIRLLSKYGVAYVIVGGEAVIYYGYGRLTGDIDFFYLAKTDNVGKLYKALNEFWDGNIPGLSNQDELLEAGAIIQFGAQPNRIDLINQIDGVSFEEVWEGKKVVTLEVENEKIPIYLIGLDQLIKNKRAMKRYKDLDDLRFLDEVKRKKEEGKR